MKMTAEKAKIVYLLILIIFVTVVGFFWLDYIGLVDMGRLVRSYSKGDASSVVGAADDEPSLIEREEFEKEKDKLRERVEELDKREAKIEQAEKEQDKEKEKLQDIRKGLELEKERIDKEKKMYSGYKKNVADLANKIISIRPEEAVQIMLNWDDPLLIDVLRQIDANALEAGKISVTSYLLSLMPRDRSSRVMNLMTQL
jgi:flagellar protein FlbB